MTDPVSPVNRDRAATLNRRWIIAGAAALCLAGPAFADASFGPKASTQALDIGVLADQTGKFHHLQDLAGPKGVVLMFFRSAAWCPFCQLQLITMNEGAAEIEKRGYRIVGVSYDKPSVNAAFTEKRKITFALLSDPGSVVIDRWGLRDPQYPVGNLAYGVPRPIIFIIDRKGMIRASLAEETFRTRPPVSEVLKAIDTVG
jgi:peroxiredoxin